MRTRCAAAVPILRSFETRTMRRHQHVAVRGLAIAGLVLLAPGAAAAQTETYCVEAQRFLVESRGMSAVTEAATIDDWRTGRRIPGCHVTAAAITTRAAQEEAERFFEAIRAAGWTRTPDPKDSPGEASLRFRKGGADCLFSFYARAMLGTEAERSVSRARVPGPGEQRYHFLVMCMPAIDLRSGA